MLARQRLPHRLWRKVDPSDIVQITIKEAHEKRASFAGTSEEQLLGWLHPMLVHRLIDELRRYGARKKDARREQPLARLIDGTSARLGMEIAATGTSPSQTLMKRETIDRLSRSLEKLPRDQRLVVELHHLQGLRPSEIASTLNRTTSSVAALLHRGLCKLRKDMKGQA